MSGKLREPELVTVKAFGHSFKLFPSLAEDLITLEKEGAIYAEFWDEEINGFRYYRVPFLPTEIFQYVEAHVAMQEFREARSSGGSFEESLGAISNREIAQRVYSYGDYGKKKLRTTGATIDNRGCAASFYGSELELLVCGIRKDRYELLPDLNHANTTALLLGMIESFGVVSRYLSDRKHGNPAFVTANEYDVQDLLFVCIRSVFRDARLEEWTPKHAGASKRIDIVVPSADVVAETKLVRSKQHANKIGDELKVDIESYHAHAACKNLFMLVWDPKNYIVDPSPLSDDLSGRRVKGTKSFDVTVLVRR